MNKRTITAAIAAAAVAGLSLAGPARAGERCEQSYEPWTSHQGGPTHAHDLGGLATAYAQIGGPTYNTPVGEAWVPRLNYVGVGSTDGFVAASPSTDAVMARSDTAGLDSAAGVGLVGADVCVNGDTIVRG